MYSEKIESIRSYLKNSKNELISQEHLQPVYAILEDLKEGVGNLEKHAIVAPQE